MSARRPDPAKSQDETARLDRRLLILLRMLSLADAVLLTALVYAALRGSPGATAAGGSQRCWAWM